MGDVRCGVLCMSLRVLFISPKNMHVLRNIPAFATELELEDRDHVDASLHADTACTKLVHNFCLSHVTSYSVFCVCILVESSAKASAATLGLNNLPGDFFFSSPQLSG